MTEREPQRGPDDLSTENLSTAKVVREFVEEFERETERAGQDSAVRRLRALLDERGIETRVSNILRLGLETVLESAPTRERGAEPISDEQRRRLRETGVTFEPFEDDVADPIVRSAMRYANLVESSFSTAEAAERLGVKPSRIRQRLQEPPSLYGFKDEDGAWRLPAFQFTDTGTLPGLGDVVPSLPDELHPLEILKWFESPNADLQFEGRAVSPRDWLSSGQRVEAVTELARALEEPR
ncbi:MAG: hypothetical protein ACOCV2_09375 [Persicimonas sp.]